jgi:hypothetical protein
MSTDLNLFQFGISNSKILQIFLAIYGQVQSPHTNVSFLFSLVSCSWVRLSPLGTSVANWRVIPAPDDK